MSGGKVWTLDAVIRMVESAGNGRATRFELLMFQNIPHWAWDQIPVIQKSNDCSVDTAKQIACTSYGFYQILGANIYATGFRGTEFDFRDEAADFTETLAGGCQQAAFSKFIDPFPQPGETSTERTNNRNTQNAQ